MSMPAGPTPVAISSLIVAAPLVPPDERTTVPAAVPPGPSVTPAPRPTGPTHGFGGFGPCSRAGARGTLSAMDVDRNRLEVLDRQDCLALLASVSFARGGLTMAALPVVLPLYFR